mmetsp:Transcript_2030/g.4515  ORF Transcript_2030/g.4515 Transcript_2030/m.4515 type:complete len:87 (-) Transcript_2030:432-692(-)
MYSRIVGVSIRGTQIDFTHVSAVCQKFSKTWAMFYLNTNKLCKYSNCHGIGSHIAPVNCNRLHTLCASHPLNFHICCQNYSAKKEN